MLLLVLLVCFSPAVLGQLEESQSNLDLTDFDFGIVGRLFFTRFVILLLIFCRFHHFFFCPQASRRVPRQVKAILAKVSHAHAHFCAALNQTLTPRHDQNIEKNSLTFFKKNWM